MRRMAEPEPALRLDVPRAEALEHATALIARAWESFDQARPEQPPVDEALRAALAAPISLEPTPVLQALDEAAVVLDRSISQPRPRFFAFVASSGLEIAVLGDALAACHDVNLAVVAGAADLVERQTLEWLGQAFGYPVATGTFSSGGTVSNMTALAAARERALPGSRHTGLSGRPCALYTSADVHESVMRAAELLGIGRDHVRAIPIDARRRMRADACAEAIDADRAAGIAPIAVVATAGTTLTGAVDPLDALADICAAARRLAPRRRRLRAARRARREPRAALRGTRARGLRDRRRAQVAVRAEGLRRADGARGRVAGARLQPQRDLRAARAGRARRGRPHARVLAPVPLAQAVARAARARTRGLSRRDRAQPRRGAALRRPRQGARRARAAGRAGAVRRARSATSPRTARSTSTTARSPPRCAPMAASTSRARTSTAPRACGRASSTSARAPRTCACCETS